MSGILHSVRMCRGIQRNIPLDVELYIRVLLLYNFYKRVFEFICMTKKGVMEFLFYFKNRQKSGLFQLLPNIQLWCLIA